MFKTIRLAIINERIIKIHYRIAKLMAMDHQCQYSAAEADRQVTELREKLLELRAKVLIIAESPKESLGDRMFRWACLWALVITCIGFLAGCAPTETAQTDSQSIGNGIRYIKDYANGNICYRSGLNISCVPMR